MPRTTWLKPITNHRIVRSVADSTLVRLAHMRTRQLDRLDIARRQRAILQSLVRAATNTRFGQEHDFANIRSVADYRARVPLRDYDSFWQTYWKDAYPKLEGITWPSKIPYYALTSGTTSGATKYIPISWQMVRSNAKAAFTSMAFFRHAYPQSQLFNGKIFFLGGSTDLRPQPDGSLAGDLSGIAVREVVEALRPYTFPTTQLAHLTNWEEKVQRLAEASIREPVTAISGVPAWLLVLFDRVKQLSGKSTIAEVWPTLRLVIHGGTKFEPYRDLFRKELGSDLISCMDTYPCSEGYIATEDPRYGLLRVIPDHNIFFEFVPVEDLGSDRPTRHCLHEVELGVQYAVVLSSCAGVWSYVVGDTVCFERRDPPLLRFTGRTKYFLSAFGEHLISEEIETAVAKAAEKSRCHVLDFHVGPVFPTDPKHPGFHRYMIEFADKTPEAAVFARIIDEILSEKNEDYAAHRVGDLSMRAPEVVCVAPGGFVNWMKSKGKYGGQHKVPRMDNTGQITTQMYEWFQSQGMVLC